MFAGVTPPRGSSQRSSRRFWRRLSAVNSLGLRLCRLENQRKIEIYATFFSNLCFEQHETMSILDSIVTIAATRLDNSRDALAAETKIFRGEGRRLLTERSALQ